MKINNNTMLKDDIRRDLQQAMKAGDTDTRDTLRMLDSMITNEEIASAQREEGLKDAQVIALVKRSVKQRRDSATQYRTGGRAELAAQEEKEITILEKYLPQQMSEDAVRAVVQNVIAKLGAQSSADLGRVMGMAMKEVGDRADGTMVRAIAQEILA